MKLEIVGPGMREVGVSVGTEAFQGQCVAEAMQGDPAELLRGLVPIKDAQASFQIVRWPTVTRMILLLHALSPSVTRDTTAT